MLCICAGHNGRSHILLFDRRRITRCCSLYYTSIMMWIFALHSAAAMFRCSLVTRSWCTSAAVWQGEHIHLVTFRMRMLQEFAPMCYTVWRVYTQRQDPSMSHCTRGCGHSYSLTHENSSTSCLWPLVMSAWRTWRSKALLIYCCVWWWMSPGSRRLR